MVVSSSRWCWCSNTTNAKNEKEKERRRRRRPFFSSRGKHQRRRDDDGRGNIVSLRRGEFKGREDPPPWEMRWSFESHLLNLRGTTTTEKDDDESRIDINAKVETSGPHSYFVNGRRHRVEGDSSSSSKIELKQSFTRCIGLELEPVLCDNFF